MKKLWITFADLIRPFDSSTCLHCHESYTVNDPLDICQDNMENGDFVWAIYGKYFNFSQAIYFVWDIGQKQRDIISESLSITEQWLSKLESDLRNKENLFEFFSKIHLQRSWGEFYSKEEFYNIITPFIEFYIRYWESVKQIMFDANTANSDEKFEEKFHELNHLFDELKFWQSYFWPYRPKCMREEEVLPYIKSFTFRGKKIMMRKNTNISQERLDEISALGKIWAIRAQIKWNMEDAIEEKKLQKIYKNWKRMELWAYKWTSIPF